MYEYPSVPTLANAPDDFLETGHLWIQEYVTGRLLRFQMVESGLLTFAGPTTRFEPDEAPPHYIAAVDSIQSTLDRDRLRAGTDAVDSYTFFGVVPLQMEVEYDWTTTPAFLGIDIWEGDEDRFAPPDVTERAFEAVGLQTVPVFEKEVPARQYNPQTYDVPESRFGTGTAAGVVLRKKTGEKAKLLADGDVHHSASSGRDQDSDGDWGSALEALITREYLLTLLDETDSDLRREPVADLARRVAADLARREFDRFESVLDRHPDAFHEAVTNRVKTVKAIHR